MTRLRPRTIWEYKGVPYEVLRLDPDLLSQDAETGHWTATIYYRLAEGDCGRDAKIFVRSAAEFERKFQEIGK